MFDGPRVGQGPGPMHQRSASERFEEAMEDGYMEVGSGCVDSIRFDSTRLDSFVSISGVFGVATVLSFSC